MIAIQDNARYEEKTNNQDSLAPDFAGYKTILKTKPKVLTINATSTASTLVVDEVLAIGDTIIVVDAANVEGYSVLLTTSNTTIATETTITGVLALATEVYKDTETVLYTSIEQTEERVINEGLTPITLDSGSTTALIKSSDVLVEGDDVLLDGWSGKLGTVTYNSPTYEASTPSRTNPVLINKYHKQNIAQATTVNDITGWTTGTSLPGSLSHSQAIVTSSRVYLLGGYDGSSSTSTVYTAPINADGTIGAWTTGTSLPGAQKCAQAIVTSSRVYLLGGEDNSAITTVYTAPINTDGTIGAWVTDTNLPGALAYSQAIVTSSRVYLLGGYSSTTVYTAPINADGTIGAWTTGTSIPGNFGVSQAVVTNSYVFLLGGNNTTTAVSTVYTAPFADGWKILTNGYEADREELLYPSSTYKINKKSLTKISSTTTEFVSSDGIGKLQAGDVVEADGVPILVLTVVEDVGVPSVTTTFVALASAPTTLEIPGRAVVETPESFVMNSAVKTTTMHGHVRRGRLVQKVVYGNTGDVVIEPLVSEMIEYGRHTIDIVDSTDPFGDGSLIEKWHLNGDGVGLKGAFNGTLTGGVTTDSGGRFGSALTFPANYSDRVNISGKPIDNLSVYSISGWVKMAQDTVFSFYMSCDNGWNSRGVVFAGGWGTIWASHEQSAVASNNTVSTPSKPDGLWHNYVYTRSGKTIKIYEDGVLMNTDTLVENTTVNDMNAYLGAYDNQGNNSGQAICSVDLVEVYNKELTQKEVTSLFTQTVVTLGIPPVDDGYIIDKRTLIVEGLAPYLTQATSAKATAMDVHAAGYEAWKVFDNDAGTYWHGTNNYGSGWITRELDNPAIIKEYIITVSNAGYSGGARNMRNFEIQGSNNNVDWTTLVAQTDYNKTGWGSPVSFPITSTEEFLYVRLYWSAKWGDNYTHFFTLDIRIEEEIEVH